MEHQAVISAGSNIDPEENTRRAGDILAAEHRLLGRSRFDRTAPVGYRDQPDFLNGAFLVVTELSREDFVRYLKEVEDRLGRERGPVKAGPRTIDLDLILWDGRVVHRDYHRAPYARRPVRELVERFSLPVIEDDEDGRLKELPPAAP